MSFIRWQPMRDMWSVRERLEQLVDELIVRGGKSLLSENPEQPAVDMYEQHGVLVIEMPVPGYKPSELEVAVNGRTLMVKGRRTHRGTVVNKTYVRRELRYGPICRTLHLPAGIDVPSTKAALTDGVLTIKVPMSSRSKQPAEASASSVDAIDLEPVLEEVVVG